MASTYEPIASTTLGSAAASVTLSSLPSTYTDLVVVLWGKGNDTNARSHAIRFNSDTGSNYSVTLLDGNGSTASSSRASSQVLAFVGAMSRSTDSPSPTIVHVMSYANTNVYKTVLSASAVSELNVRRYVNLWRSTSAIDSITWLRNDGTNIAAGSQIAVYGIKAA